MNASAKIQTSTVQFAHAGEALLARCAEYPLLFQAAMEVVQNEIDSGASHIGLILNQQKRDMIVTGNGSGASLKQFEEALKHVGKTMKSSNEDQYGRYGIGLVSPIDKCLRYTFTSCASKGDGRYRTWTFSQEDIKEMKATVKIPWEFDEELTFNSGGSGRLNDGIKEVPWRTRVHLHRYTSDRTINRIDNAQALADGIAERFGKAILDRKIQISISFTNETGKKIIIDRVEVPEFSGRPIDEVIYEHPDAGDTVFRLFLRKDGKGSMRVLVKGNPYHIPMKEFISSLHEYVSPEVVAALTSGILEGEIIATHPEMHKNRKKFVFNDACAGFFEQLQAWFDECGVNYIEQAHDTTAEERYQRVGMRSLLSLAEFCKLKSNTAISDYLSGLKKSARTGQGETPFQEKSALGARSAPSAGSSSSSTPSGGKRNPHDGRKPFSSLGPNGKKRRVVKNDHLGLQFEHSEMPGSSKLWEFDDELGIFRFNIRHPEWEKAERSESQMMRLQEFIAIQVLSVLSTTPPEWQEKVLMGLEETLAPSLWLFRNSPAFNIRISKKKRV